jgi:hypothetical protein
VPRKPFAQLIHQYGRRFDKISLQPVIVTERRYFKRYPLDPRKQNESEPALTAKANVF